MNLFSQNNLNSISAQPQRSSLILDLSIHGEFTPKNLNEKPFKNNYKNLT